MLQACSSERRNIPTAATSCPVSILLAAQWTKSVPAYPPYGKRLLIDHGWCTTIRNHDVDLVAGGIKREPHQTDVIDDMGDRRAAPLPDQPPGEKRRRTDTECCERECFPKRHQTSPAVPRKQLRPDGGPGSVARIRRSGCHAFTRRVWPTLSAPSRTVSTIALHGIQYVHYRAELGAESPLPQRVPDPNAADCGRRTTDRGCCGGIGRGQLDVGWSPADALTA